MAPRAHHAQGSAGDEVMRVRIAIVGALFAAVFLVIAGRMVHLMGFRVSVEPEIAVATAASPFAFVRADITDRNGRQLATDLAVASLFADARQVWDAAETTRALVEVFPELDPVALEAKLSSRRGFVWIRRDLTPRQHATVHQLGLPGLDYRTESWRVYPNGRAAAHVLGYVDVDNHGIAGIERGLDDLITSPSGSPAPVALSIDLRAQHVLDDELALSMEKFQAIGACGLIMDVDTGEIIAMTSLPDFDPNNIALDPAGNRFNCVTLGVYEMGSTFKVFNTAMALDSGLVGIDDTFDASQPIRVSRFEISDYRPLARVLSVSEIFQHSSNIGSARMAMVVGRDRQKAFLDTLGLLSPPRLELPEIGRPIVPALWTDLEVMTISFGHGIAISPLQIGVGVSAMVNGGYYIDPTVRRREPGQDIPRRRVISEETSAQMRTLMRLVVAQGTGSKADVVGYPVAGKTGTGEKPVNGRYDRKALISSFVGVFPADKPEYLVLIILDEPKPTAETSGYATGGWTAAPTASHVIARIGPILGVAPRSAPEVDNSGETAVAVVGEGR